MPTGLFSLGDYRIFGLPTITRTIMKVVKMMKGCGAGISLEGNIPVEFQLDFYQNEGADGTERICGWVRPRFGERGELLTLKADDVGTVNFAFVDHGVSVVTVGEIS